MIDVIVATYNRSKLLELTLSSILGQAFNLTGINVIVVDDGSNDNTPEVVEAYSKKLAIQYLYQEDKGYRVASARNMGLKAGNADICIFLDAGILLESDCVQKHVDFHSKHNHPASAIGYVYGFDVGDPDLTRLEAIVGEIPDTARLIKRFESNRIYLDPREPEYLQCNYEIDKLPAPWVFWWSGHVSVNRKYLRSEIYFDTVFEPRYGYEDIDLGYRLYKNNVRIFLLKEAKAFHYPHRKIQNQMNDLKHNADIFYQKHPCELIRLFNSHGGTFGFNDLLLNSNREGVVPQANSSVLS